MLGINLVGFGPTYFFKAFFRTPDLPLRTHVHGIIFTSWFVLFLIQTTLVARRRVSLHRRLGTLAGLLLPAMVVSGLVIVYFRALEYDGTRDSLVTTTLVVLGNMAPLALFTGFAVLGILYRRRREVHRRLMLLASFGMMGQSLGRLGRFPAVQFSDAPLLNEVIFGLGGLVALLGSLCAYDLITRRRPHPVTAVGCPVFLGSILFAALVLPYTSVAQSIILWINQGA